jgi:cytidyltransferase-like protein
MKIVAVSGYFDPLHVGHIDLFELAQKLGDKLVVIVNNNKQTEMKKGKYFMPVEERKKILEALKCVDEVFVSIDEDRSVCKSIEKVHELFGVNVFVNGGDRFNYEVPEAEVCKKLGIEIIDGLGKKIQSSSELIKNFEENKK